MKREDQKILDHGHRTDENDGDPYGNLKGDREEDDRPIEKSHDVNTALPKMTMNE